MGRAKEEVIAIAAPCMDLERSNESAAVSEQLIAEEVVQKCLPIVALEFGRQSPGIRAEERRHRSLLTVASHEPHNPGQRHVDEHLAALELQERSGEVHRRVGVAERI